MSEINDFLNALLEDENEEDTSNNNDELDLGEVFDFFCEEATPHELRFPDGSTGRFTFD